MLRRQPSMENDDNQGIGNSNEFDNDNIYIYIEKPTMIVTHDDSSHERFQL